MNKTTWGLFVGFWGVEKSYLFLFWGQGHPLITQSVHTWSCYWYATLFLAYYCTCTSNSWHVDTGGPSVSTLREKGTSAINQASSIRKDSIHTVPGEKIHKGCRQNYCNSHRIAKDTKQEESRPSACGHRFVLRSSEEEFSFKTDCFFCGRPAKFGKKNKRQDVLQVMTIGLKNTVLAACCERVDTVVGQILGRHAFCTHMTYMQQVQFITRLVGLTSTLRSRCQ